VDEKRGGPYWNFSVPAAADYWVDEVIGELTREADINSVFFDETDLEYCSGASTPGCHHSLRDGELAQLYRDKIQVLRRSALKLNAAGIFPMFSSFNSFNSSKCAGVDYAEYYGALSDVGWFRFYEFFSASSLPNMLLETQLGLPVVVHDSSPGWTIDLSLAAFLIAQGNYSYFGSSTGWEDPSWRWKPEYDTAYGAPLSVATKNASGWSREFEHCSVFVAADFRSFKISMRNESSSKHLHA
jgi:hypothetical protein